MTELEEKRPAGANTGGRGRSMGADSMLRCQYSTDVLARQAVRGGDLAQLEAAAEVARARGDRQAFWDLRRQFLLAQAEIYLQAEGVT